MITEPKAWFDENGIRGKNAVRYEKRLKDMPGIYQNVEKVDPELLLYTVYSYEPNKEENPGNLYWGLTVLEPVTVNGECAMTKGHFHVDKTCAEFYFCMGGSGLLLLVDESGKTWAEKMEKGSLHYIGGTWAHRLVNTGYEQLKVGACWPTAAGHDYDAVLNGGFGARVFKRDAGIVWEEQ